MNPNDPTKRVKITSATDIKAQEFNAKPPSAHEQKMANALAGAKAHSAKVREEVERARSANTSDAPLKCLRCTCPRAMPGVFVDPKVNPVNDVIDPKDWWATYRGRNEVWNGPPMCQVCYEETGARVLLRVRPRLIDAVDADAASVERLAKEDATPNAPKRLEGEPS